MFADMLVLIEAMQLILCDGGASVNLLAFINGSAVPKETHMQQCFDFKVPRSSQLSNLSAAMQISIDKVYVNE